MSREIRSGGRGSGDRAQRSEVGYQRSEDGGGKSEVGYQRSEGKGPDVRGRISEVGGRTKASGP
jgi:hypothetical protein